MSETNQDRERLLPNEYIVNAPTLDAVGNTLTDSDINSKYMKGEVRIVTEQARYPINSIASIVEDPSYKMSPEYQRRKSIKGVRAL